MAYFYFALVSLVFGSNFVLMHRAAQWYGPAEVGFWRLATAAAVVLGLWATFDRRQRLRRRDLAVIATIGLLVSAYPYVLQPMLLARGMEHSFLGVTVAFTPVLTVIVSPMILGVRPTRRQSLGVVAGLGFVMLLMIDGGSRGVSPALLAAAATVPLGYAVGNSWMQRSLHHADSTPMTAAMLVTSAAVLLPIVLSDTLQQRLALDPPVPRRDFLGATAALAGLGPLGTGVSVWAFVRIVKLRGPLFAGMVTYVVPVIAMLWGAADSERITPRQVIAIAGVIATVALVQTPDRRVVAAETGRPPAAAKV